MGGGREGQSRQSEGGASNGVIEGLGIITESSMEKHQESTSSNKPGYRIF